jgi:hypothetical protein
VPLSAGVEGNLKHLASGRRYAVQYEGFSRSVKWLILIIDVSDDDAH